jgi:hypothetical protein
MIADFLAALAAPHETEPAVARRARLEQIANVVQQQQPPAAWPYGAPAWHGLLARTWYEEGARFSLEVHAGRKRGDSGRAACLGQVWSHGTLLPRAEWLQTMGTDEHSTRACARATSLYLTIGVERCIRPNLTQLENTARVVMLYGTGARCVPMTRGKPATWAWDRAAGAIRWAQVFNQ